MWLYRIGCVGIDIATTRTKRCCSSSISFVFGEVVNILLPGPSFSIRTVTGHQIEEYYFGIKKFSFHKLTTNQFQEMLKALHLFKDRAVDQKKNKDKQHMRTKQIKTFWYHTCRQLLERLRA